MLFFWFLIFYYIFFFFFYHPGPSPGLRDFGSSWCLRTRPSSALLSHPNPVLPLDTAFGVLCTWGQKKIVSLGRVLGVRWRSLLNFDPFSTFNFFHCVQNVRLCTILYTIYRFVQRTCGEKVHYPGSLTPAKATTGKASLPRRTRVVSPKDLCGIPGNVTRPWFNLCFI